MSLSIRGSSAVDTAGVCEREREQREREKRRETEDTERGAERIRLCCAVSGELSRKYLGSSLFYWCVCVCV